MLPTPRLGGLGIVAAVVASIGLGLALGLDAMRLLPLLAVAAVVAGLSLIDDLRGLPALVRLVVHAAAAAVVVGGIGAFVEIRVAPDPLLSPSGGLLLSPALGAAVTAAWIVGFVNAFNFMDGIDGIAALQAVIAGLAWAAIGWLLDEPALALLGVAVAAACVGFLAHNWSPASIFMGDVGSAFLGFLLAAGALATRPPRSLLVPTVLTVWPFVFDTSLTLARRVRRRENLLAAHRSHLYQRLDAGRLVAWRRRRALRRPCCRRRRPGRGGRHRRGVGGARRARRRRHRRRRVVDRGPPRRTPAGPGRRRRHPGFVPCVTATSSLADIVRRRPVPASAPSCCASTGSSSASRNTPPPSTSRSAPGWSSSRSSSTASASTAATGATPACPTCS